MPQDKKVSFTQMKDGTAADYALLEKLEKPYLALTAARVKCAFRARAAHSCAHEMRILRAPITEAFVKCTFRARRSQRRAGNANF